LRAAPYTINSLLKNCFPLVILSEAKNLLFAPMLKQKQMLRFAQHDSGGEERIPCVG